MIKKTIVKNKDKKVIEKTAKKEVKKVDAPKEKISVEAPVVSSAPKLPDTLGGSRIEITRVEQIEVNGKKENRIYLVDGSITVLNDEDFNAQKNQ